MSMPNGRVNPNWPHRSPPCYGHAQTSGPEHGGRHSLGPPGTQTSQKQHAGLLELDAPPSVASSRLPEGAAPKVSASVRRTHIRDTYAASGPGPGTWKDAGPGRRSSRGSGGLRLGLPAWQRRLCDACGLSHLNHFLTLWSQPYMPSCNRRVTSTSIHMARPGPASAPHGHAPLYADILSLARTISERRISRNDCGPAAVAECDRNTGSPRSVSPNRNVR